MLDVAALYAEEGSAHDLREDVKELKPSSNDAAQAFVGTEAAMNAVQAADAVNDWCRP
jgi:hypothetical protein